MRTATYFVGKRIEKWLENSYDDVDLLLPYEQKLSYLYIYDVLATVPNIRLKF